LDLLASSFSTALHRRLVTISEHGHGFHGKPEATFIAQAPAIADLR
jgi:hypothetical protein